VFTLTVCGEVRVTCMGEGFYCAKAERGFQEQAMNKNWRTSREIT
jgi:hypothetical protein